MSSSPERRIHGFTLIEMLVVVTVLIILISFFSPVIKQALIESKRGALQAQLAAIGQGIEAYYLTFEGYPGYFSNTEIANTSVFKQFTGTENLVLSMMGYALADNGTPLEAVQRAPTQLAGLRKIDVRRIGEGPAVKLPNDRGIKKYGAFYTPKSTELLAIGGTQNSTNLTDDNNIPEFLDISVGLPILYLRSGGLRAQMVDTGNGDVGMFALRHIKDYTAATNLQSPDGTVYNQVTQGTTQLSRFNAAGDSTTEANQLAWLVINPAMSQTDSKITSNNSTANDAKGDVPRGQFILMGPGPDGIYFDRRQVTGSQISAPGQVGAFDDVIYAGGGAR
jgi:prepilin-type N-terminal cleavage/methylation domain-containing protein